MVQALATYYALERTDQTRAIAKFRSSAQIDREVENFKVQVKNLKSPEDLYKNRRLMNFVLSAYGLDSEINSLGRVKAALNSDITDTNSIVNRLQDRRFREAAGDLLIQATGVTNLQLPTVVTRVVDRYVSAEYEKLLGRQDPAIREARYFAKNIGKVTSIYDLLGDNVLRSVVTEALGLPRSLAIQPIESQAEAIRRRLDITQFKTAAVSQPAQTRANAVTDVTNLVRASAIADSAAARADEIALRLTKTLSGYDGLTALQDPNGANAAEIAVHSAAIPELVRQRGLLTSAESSIGRLADSLNRMSALRNLASNPGNAASLTAYQTEFAALAQAIHDEVSDGASYRFDGVSQNLLDGSLTGPLTTTINSGGGSVSLRAHDLSGFLAQIDTAAVDFAAVTAAGESDELTATATAISLGGPLLGAVRDQLVEDRTAAATAISRVTNFTATLDTTALATARTSLADADSRAQQIAAKLAELRSVAASSAALGPGDDRSTLSSNAATLIADINALITTPAIGADNLLDATARDYSLTGAKSLTIRGRGFDTAIGTPLASASVDDAASANALIAQINTAFIPTITRARESLGVDKDVATEAATIFSIAVAGSGTNFPPLGIYNGRYDFYITNHLMMTGVVAAILVLTFVYVASRVRVRGEGLAAYQTKGRLAQLFETMCSFIRDEVARPNLGKLTDKYIPYIWTIFFFILFSNVIGLVPIGYFLQSLTGDVHFSHWGGTATGNLALNVILAVGTFIAILFIGIRETGAKAFFSHFNPIGWDDKKMLVIGLPLYVLEWMGLFIKCTVLAMRLFGTMMAGHLVIAAFVLLIFSAAKYSLTLGYGVEIAVIIGGMALTLLEIFICFLQAFIFTFLTVLFISTVAAHHGDHHDEHEDDPFSDEGQMDLDKLIKPERLGPLVR